MDYKTLYSPTEATALYNVAKIKYDPTSYSLKGNLITGSSIDSQIREHIHIFNYDSEEYLLGCIYKHEPKITAKDITGKSGKYARISGIASEAAGTFVQQDNLHVSVDKLSEFIPLETIKKTKVMQTLVTMCVALNSAKSCAKELLFLASDMCEEPYDVLHTFKYLKDALMHKAVHLRLMRFGTSIDTTYTVTQDDRLGMDDYCSSDIRGVDSLYSLYLGMFEAMWAWNSLEPELKRCFVGICNLEKMVHSGTLNLFSEHIKLTDTEFEVSEALKDAISVNDPKERYQMYQEILKVDGDKIYERCEKYFNSLSTSEEYLRFLPTAFASFAMQISEVNIRINTIRILHEYALANGYITPKDLEDGSISDKLADAFSDTLGESTGTAETSKSKSLKSFEDEPATGIPKPTKDTDHDSSAMFEALDKSGASFKSGQYAFDVEDCIDTGPTFKSKYEAVAKKVTLVNQLLIRRIRDIKTYNVGGKNPGAKSGRLDRKTMYRYKYDPNIFYNNTYKTLESDLAFGIILDESGSMCGRGIEDGRVTMIVLHETLKALGINHSIIGHTSSRNYHCKIARYQSFREDKTYTTTKNFALVKATAKSGNCDSGALYYMEKAFDRVRNKDKVCLIFSDGAPTECTGDDLKTQVRNMERKGIKVIGIGINFESIAKYYTEYANGRNLSDMLSIVSNILEQYVLKKKDK